MKYLLAILRDHWQKLLNQRIELDKTRKPSQAELLAYDKYLKGPEPKGGKKRKSTNTALIALEICKLTALFVSLFNQIVRFHFAILDPPHAPAKEMGFGGIFLRRWQGRWKLVHEMGVAMKLNHRLSYSEFLSGATSAWLFRSCLL